MSEKGFFSRIKSLFIEDVIEQEVKSDDVNEKDTEDENIEKEGSEEINNKKEKGRKSKNKAEVKEIIEHIIEPEERTWKNYLSFSFWKDKQKVYKKSKIKEKQDLDVYKTLSDGARPTIEYYVLTILSCIIATIGLIQGSSAVIIGAMIVAPLMTPILAFSLSVIWGDVQLMQISILSIIKGSILAIVISALIAYIVPLPVFTQEILSRSKPSLFDILVAMASGTVGAYGYANKKISSALVGIAIAVALMPPLCTIGIGLGTFNKAIASGSSVLFIINLVAMSLAAAIVFWIMKIHPILVDEEEVKHRALYQIILSLVILLGIAIPIGIYMYQGYNVGKAKRITRQLIEEKFNGASILNMKTEKTESQYNIHITLTGSKTPDPDKLLKIKHKIINQFNNIKQIKINFIQCNRLLE